MGVVFTQSPPQRALEVMAGPQLGRRGQGQSSGALEAPSVLHLPGSCCDGHGPGVTGPSGPSYEPAVSPHPATVHAAALSRDRSRLPGSSVAEYLATLTPAPHTTFFKTVFRNYF